MSGVVPVYHTSPLLCEEPQNAENAVERGLLYFNAVFYCHYSLASYSEQLRPLKTLISCPPL